MRTPLPCPASPAVRLRRRPLTQAALLGLVVTAAACNGGGTTSPRLASPAPALRNMTLSPSTPWVGVPVLFSAQCVPGTPTDTVSGQIEFGDQQSAPVLSTSHVYTEAGSYQVVFTCTDEQLSLQAQQMYSVTVTPAPPADTASGGGSSSGGGTSSSGDGSSSGGGSSGGSSSSGGDGSSSGAGFLPGSGARVTLGAGSATSVLIRADGSVVAAGAVVGGEPTPLTGTSAVLIPGAQPAVAVEVDGALDTAFALRTDGTVVAWGLNDGPVTQNSSGLLGSLTSSLFDSYLGLPAGSPAIVDAPVTVKALAGVAQIRASQGVLLARSIDGGVSILPGNQTLDLTSNLVGGGAQAVQGLGTIVSLGTPSQQQLYFPVVDSGGAVTLISLQPYTLTSTLLSNVLGTQYTLTAVTGLPVITQVACGDASSGPFCLALAADGGVLAWGGNDEGELGNGKTTALSTPARISGLTGITQVAASTGNAYALAGDGTVYAWGRLAGVGQATPDGTPASTFYVPTLVPGLTDIRHITARGTDVLAVDGQGNVWGWGSNANGELGSGTRGAVGTPVQFVGISLN